MLFLQLPLLLALLMGGDNEQNKNSVPEGRYVCVCVCVCVCVHVHTYVYGVVSQTRRLRVSA